MAQSALNTPAPDFAPSDFQGRLGRLTDVRGKKSGVQVFNRGFR
jgi:hypothetical protein